MKNKREDLKDVKALSFKEIPVDSCFCYIEDLNSRSVIVAKKLDDEKYYSFLKSNTYTFDKRWVDEKLFVCVVHPYYGKTIYDVPDEPPHYVISFKPFQLLGMDLI